MMSVPDPQGFALSAKRIKMFCFFPNSHSDVTISERRISYISFFRQVVEFYCEKNNLTLSCLFDNLTLYNVKRASAE